MPETIYAEQEGARRITPLAIVWGALGVILCALIVARLMIGGEPLNSAPAQLPVYGSIPDFKLVESSGKDISISDLKGKVWVASLFFTHCAASCPMMASQLAKFQERVDNPDIVLVSISVDPERDTPERLREYANLTGAKPGRWYFLTGAKDTIVELAEEHLKLGTGQKMEDYSTPAELREKGESETNRIEELAKEAAQEAIGAASPEDEWAEWERGWEVDTNVSVPGEGAAVEDPILHSDRFALVDRQGRIRGYYNGLDEKEVEQLRADAQRLLGEGNR